MKLKIDQEADALYLSLTDMPVEYSEEVAPGIVVDYDAHNQVVGIEILSLSKRVPATELHRLLFEAAPQAG